MLISKNLLCAVHLKFLYLRATTVNKLDLYSHYLHSRIKFLKVRFNEPLLRHLNESVLGARIPTENEVALTFKSTVVDLLDKLYCEGCVGTGSRLLGGCDFALLWVFGPGYEGSELLFMRYRAVLVSLYVGATVYSWHDGITMGSKVENMK